MLKFLTVTVAFGGLAIGAHVYSTKVVMERITEFQETLIGPGGRRIDVARDAAPRILTRPGAAWRDTVEEAPFGWRVTYSMMGGRTVTCTYRLPGIACDEGWTVVWSRHGR